MSGGSLDYAFRHVEEAASRIESEAEDPLHLAFAAKLRLAAKALHDLEWTWSGDYGRGREVSSIEQLIRGDADLVRDAQRWREVVKLVRQVEGKADE